MIQGSSISMEVVEKAKSFVNSGETILVVLDSNHTHEHVLRELELYSPLVSANSYLVVFDTIVENLPDNYVQGKPWGKGNNPHTAVVEFLEKQDNFEIDHSIDNKLLISVAPGGYLKRIR